LAEVWLPVVGWELEYEVSNEGHVRSLDRVIAVRNRWGTVTHRRHKAFLLKPVKSGQRGYLAVQLGGKRRGERRYVHHLMLEAFVGPRPPGLQGLHYDDNVLNNMLGNLRWDTLSANQLDCVRNGNHSMARRNQCVNGHEYTLENTIQRGRARICRQCREDIESRRIR
jgi:hypothetical protein